MFQSGRPIIVAPHGGAWIEIDGPSGRRERARVAPHGGAWIEICRDGNTYSSGPVAPHGGAWIEIPGQLFPRFILASPLTEGRGLKLVRNYSNYVTGGSPLTEGRGLKLLLLLFRKGEGFVAPHGGAWIEINRILIYRRYTLPLHMSPLTEGRGLKFLRYVIGV